MRVLIVSEGIPSLIGGGRSRQFNLIKALSEKHQLTVITYADNGEEQAVENLRAYCENVIVIDRPPSPRSDRSTLYFRFTGWKHTLLELQPKRGRWLITEDAKAVVRAVLQQVSFDIIQVHQGYLAPLLPKRVSSATLLDMHDVLSDYEKRVFESSSGFGFRLGPFAEWRKMNRFEKKTIRYFDACTVVSENDRKAVLELVPDSDPIIVPNGVDVDYFRPIDSQMFEPIVVFVGSMNYFPNESGMLHFCKAIWPKVKGKFPRARLDIVGTSPSDSILELHGKGDIAVIGEVPDVRPYLTRAAVSICPIYLGSGTRLKILDAWAMGKAVVSTRLGAEGLETAHGQNILLTDSDDAFSSSVVKVLSDPDLGESLGCKGRNTVEREYSWNRISKKIEAAYEQAIRKSRNRLIDQKYNG